MLFIFIGFFVSLSAFATRTMNVTYSPQASVFWSSGYSTVLQCTIINPQPVTQTVTVVSYKLASSLAENTVRPENGILRTDSFTLAQGQSYVPYWFSSSGTNFPVWLQISVKEDRGVIQGDCHFYSYGGPTVYSQSIALNGGRPF